MTSRDRLAILALASSAALSGCTTSPPQWFGFDNGAESSSIVTRSTVADTQYAPTFTTAIYRYIDSNQADVYLTDVSVSRLADPNDTLADVSGTLVHIHLFLVPLAGETPIASTACNAAVRQVVFAGAPNDTRAAIGVYTGGGFISPFGDGPGGQTLGGVISDASLRLAHSSPGFADRLKSAQLTGTFSTRLDDEAGRAIADRLAQLTLTLPPYTAPTDPRYADAVVPLPTRMAPADKNVPNSPGAGKGL